MTETTVPFPAPNFNLSDSFLAPELRNSKHLKQELATHMFFRLGYSIVIDEFRFMDIFGVRKNGYGVEFEIKVSKSDLDRELRIIKGERPKNSYSKEWEKWKKHALYLGKTIRANSFFYGEDHRYTPNEFNFYVPDYLSDYAVSQLQNTPYGVIKIGKTASGNPDYFYNSSYEIIKKATKLHQEKVPQWIINDIAHGLTIRNKLFK